MQYNLERPTAVISSLSSRNVFKYQFLVKCSKICWQNVGKCLTSEDVLRKSLLSKNAAVINDFVIEYCH